MALLVIDLKGFYIFNLLPLHNNGCHYQPHFADEGTEEYRMKWHIPSYTVKKGRTGIVLGLPVSNLCSSPLYFLPPAQL